MADCIEGVERQQATLFPERLDELVPADALVRVIDGFVGQLDVEAAGFIRARPAGIGRPGYRPGDLLRLFLWGYLNGVRSGRALERACWRDLEAAWLMCRLQPDFKTIADFRKNNGAAITWTCRSFVRFALERGLIGGREVATDGSRFAAASSRRRRQTREEVEAEIAAHEAAIEGYLEDLEAADALVDPAEQAAERKRVEKALAELEAEAARKREALAATAAKKLVVAAPESVIFGQSDGRQPSYNVQLSVDIETQVIIDSEPVGNPSDSGQPAPTASRLAPLLGVRPPASDGTLEPALDAPTGAEADAVAEATAAEPAAVPVVTLVADAGYSSANDAITCEKLGLVPVFPVLRTVNPHGKYFNRTDFEHDALRDLMLCPAGKELKPLPEPEDGAIRYKARKADCGACALKEQCTTAKARTVLRLINEPALDRVAERLKAAPDLMAKRAQSVEPAFGTLNAGYPSFGSRRGAAASCCAAATRPEPSSASSLSPSTSTASPTSTERRECKRPSPEGRRPPGHAHRHRAAAPQRLPPRQAIGPYSDRSGFSHRLMILPDSSPILYPTSLRAARWRPGAGRRRGGRRFRRLFG
jgi:transposase